MQCLFYFLPKPRNIFVSSDVFEIHFFFFTDWLPTDIMLIFVISGAVFSSWHNYFCNKKTVHPPSVAHGDLYTF